MAEFKLPITEFKLPKKISIDVAKITTEEWEIAQKDLKIIKFLLQEINDNLAGNIDSKNILEEGVEEFNIKDLTADKVTTGILRSTDGKTYFDLDNNIIIIEVEEGRWIKFGDIGDDKYGILASKDEVEKFRLEADSGDAYFSGKAIGAVYNE